MKLRLTTLLTLMLTVFVGTFAQTDNPMLQPLPIDPAVRKGTLPNGLTYYIRHNAWPEKRVDFYIAQKVGSMQEEDNQRGLAHFLEHMCFNGTTHFPGDGIKQYLETIGIKFGQDLNAYTSFDQTVYNINNVPSERGGAIDTCLLILHDWSHDLTLDGKEIDKERGVINEEWRMRSSAMLRMYEKALPTIYTGSKYGHRLPIGTMDIVMNFPHDDLRAYYRRWYRPDLQAIIVVGDIDVDDIEARIKTVFADIQLPSTPSGHEYFPVPDNKEPIVTINKDKEQGQNMIYIMRKHDAVPDEINNTMTSIVFSYMRNAIASMFSQRIDEIMQQENPPFLGANMVDENFLVSKTKGSLDGIVGFKDNGHREALSALYREMLRAYRHGFTVTEYERYKQEFKAQMEDAYAQRDKVFTKNYVQECVNNFLDNEAMPGIEWEHQVLPELAEGITVADINQQMQALMSDSNLVVAMFAPDKEDINYPTREELLEILASVEAEDIEPYAEEVNNDPLIPELRPAGKVKSVKDDAYDAKLVTLSNGIRIHVKHTDFSPNTISMTSASWGGTSLYSNDEYPNSSCADMVSLGGWGNFSAVELQKKLAGVQASVAPSISDRGESISGQCVKKDLEAMLQLTYLCFTAPRKDEAAYNSTINRIREQLRNAELDPTTALQDTLASVLYNNNVRALRTRPEDIDKLNYDRILEIYRERVADANDFEFFFIGDIDLDEALPLFEKYLGSLPVLKSKEKYNIIDKRKANGEIKNVFEKEQETPNSITLFIYHTPMKDTQRNNLTLSMLSQSLQMLFTETVREDEGGAYGVPTSAGMSNYPVEEATVQIQLPTAPDKRDRMAEVIYKGIEDICANGPKPEFVQKIKEYMLRSHTEALNTNSYWLGAMVNLARHNQENHANYERIVNEITIADIQAMANTIFHSGNRIEVGMTSPVQK